MALILRRTTAVILPSKKTQIAKSSSSSVLTNIRTSNPYKSSNELFSTLAMSDNNSVDSSESNLTTTTNVVDDTTDIEDMHMQALKNGSTTYIDPPTGFSVFTDLIHLKRGNCCGNRCRHCPYGYEDVRNAARRPAKLRSGDREAADQLIEAAKNGKPVMEAKLPPLTDEQLKEKQQNRPQVRRKKRGYVRKKDREAVNNQANNTSPTSSTSFTDTSTTLSSSSSTSKSNNKTRVTTSKNVPYTRKGDGGSSQLGTGERRPKDDANFEAMGTVDELCSFVGVVDAHLDPDVDYGNLSELLLSVMSRLFDIGSHIAKPAKKQSTGDDESNPRAKFSPNGLGDGFDPKNIEDLEEWMNIMTDELPELTSFILPTGAIPAAHLHVARTVCRRAERVVLPLVRDDQTCDPHALKYLNRLSDFFFVAARWVNYCHDEPETQFQRDSPGMTQREVVSRSLQKGR